MAGKDETAIWVSVLLGRLPAARVTVFGDFCLDVYWLLDTGAPEYSVETGLALHRVREQRFSAGGAGSVVANLVEMGVGTIRAVGALGKDIFGQKMLELLAAKRVETDGLVLDDAVQTMVYAKPYSRDVEHNRLDFGAFNTYPAELVDRVLGELERAVETSDVVILNQQVPGSLSSPEVIGRINGMIASHPEKVFISDARHYLEHYQGALWKLNTHEAARVLGESAADDHTRAEADDYARRVRALTGKPAFVTRGEHGLVAAGEDGRLIAVPGVQIVEKTDSVGAGDAVVAGIAAALAVGESIEHAAAFANIAASITVRQLQCTGTASAAQILAAVEDLNYVLRPELAASVRMAKYVPGTEIELTGELPRGLAIKHCIFDHDGTLSVLREGWEKIMEPMMLRAILGKHHDTVDAATFAKVEKTAKEFIDRTTGIQTLVQMKGLAELVRQTGFVDEADVLDEHGYKKLYNDELMKMIARRVEKLKTGELSTLDFQIKNAGLLLETLYARGIKLYLASGTDVADVIAEAEAMGYAPLFEGRIFGAVGDVKVEAKRIVLEKIIGENNLRGHEFATFGDGPVELRETRRRGGIAVGVASDELRRFGLNLSKRQRLIRAGADVIVPDYSQLGALLKTLAIA